MVVTIPTEFTIADLTLAQSVVAPIPVAGTVERLPFVIAAVRIPTRLSIFDLTFAHEDGLVLNPVSGSAIIVKS